jgi:heptosyltransferase-2
MAENLKNILIIRTDRIGDVVLTTPAIHALRQAFPRYKISMLVSPFTTDLVKGNGDVDEILVDDRQGRHKGWLGFWRLVHDIQSRHFDIVVNFHTKKRTNLMCFLSKIPRRIGYKNNKFGFLLTDRVTDDRPQGVKHEAQYCLDLLRVLGVEAGELTLFLPVQRESERWAEDFIQKCRGANPGAKAAALHLGASCPTKRWPVQYFADLIRMMSSRYHVFFIIIGTDEHQGMVKDLRRLAGAGVFYDLTGKNSLAQTVSVLKRCDVLISSDSGPVHIAAAFGTPVVSIFTRNQPGINPERWGPLGKFSRYVAPPLDMGISFAKGELEDHGFLYRVTPQQVFDVVDALF